MSPEFRTPRDRPYSRPLLKSWPGLRKASGPGLFDHRPPVRFPGERKTCIRALMTTMMTRATRPSQDDSEIRRDPARRIRTGREGTRCIPETATAENSDKSAQSLLAPTVGFMLAHEHFRSPELISVGAADSGSAALAGAQPVMIGNLAGLVVHHVGTTRPL